MFSVAMRGFDTNKNNYLEENERHNLLAYIQVLIMIHSWLALNCLIQNLLRHENLEIDADFGDLLDKSEIRSPDMV